MMSQKWHEGDSFNTESRCVCVCVFTVAAGLDGAGSEGIAPRWGRVWELLWTACCRSWLCWFPLLSKAEWLHPPDPQSGKIAQAEEDTTLHPPQGYRDVNRLRFQLNLKSQYTTKTQTGFKTKQENKQQKTLHTKHINEHTSKDSGRLMHLAPFSLHDKRLR